jgi:hypothetical protein
MNLKIPRFRLKTTKALPIIIYQDLGFSLSHRSEGNFTIAAIRGRRPGG